MDSDEKHKHHHHHHHHPKVQIISNHRRHSNQIKKVKKIKTHEDGVHEVFQYQIVRSVEGNSYKYDMIFDDAPLFSCDVKGRHPCQPFQITFKGGSDFIFIPNKSCTEFQLAHQEKQLIISKIFKSEEYSFFSPQYRISFEIFSLETNTSIILLSKVPHKDESGVLRLNFHNHFVISSTKNAIFYFQDDEKEEEKIIIR